MTKSAGHIGVSRGEQEACGAVIECGRRPADRGVAGRAIRGRKRRACRRVHGICGRLPGRQMASGISAIAGCNGQIVVVIDVAQRAGHVGMAVAQQKPGGAVVEFCIQPIVERMAGGAVGSRELRSGRLVRWIGRSLPIR